MNYFDEGLQDSCKSTFAEKNAGKQSVHRTGKLLFAVLSVFVFLFLCGTFCQAGDDYPIKEYRNRKLVHEPYGFGVGECTSFACHCLRTRNKVAFYNQYVPKGSGKSRGTWGHAAHWGAEARRLGIAVDMNPAPGAIAWWEAGDFGHVAWVKSVSGSKVLIEEYNYPTPEYTEKYHTRTIGKNEVSGYIHIRDLHTVKICQKTNGKYTSVGNSLTIYLDKNNKPNMDRLYVQLDGKENTKAVTLKSSVPEVVAWKDGMLTVKKEGTAKLSATYKDTVSGNSATATVSVTVKKSSTYIGKSFSLTLGSTYQFFPDIVGPSKKTTWKCSNESVLRLDKSNGRVKAVKTGTAVVTVTANGISDSLKVTVTKRPSIKLNKTNLTITKGRTAPLTVTTEGIKGKITWYSSNTGVATVKNGKVTARKAGTATITVWRSAYYAKCKVTVRNPAIDLSKYFRKKYADVKQAFMKGTLEKGYDSFSETDYYQYSVGKCIRFTFYHPAKAARQAPSNDITLTGKAAEYNIYGITYGMAKPVALTKVVLKGFTKELDRQTPSAGEELVYYGKNGDDHTSLGLLFSKGVVKMINLNYVYE